MTAFDRDDPPLRKEDARIKTDDGLRASPFTEDVFDDEYYGRKRRGGLSVKTVGGIVCVAIVIAAVGWYVIGEHRSVPAVSEGGIPLVKADPTPYKFKPDNPGGMEVDNQDKLVYDRVAKGEPPTRTENLLPPPEQPHAPEQTTQAPPAPSPSPPSPDAHADDPMAKLVAKVDGQGTTPAPTSAPAAAMAPGAATAPPTTTAPAAAMAPGAATAPATTTAPAAAPGPALTAPPAAPASTPAPPATSAATTSGGPLLLVPADTAEPPAPTDAVPAQAPPAATVASAAPPPAPAKSAAAAPLSAAAGSVAVQLASARSEDAAMGEWKRISGKNSDLLSGLTPTVQQADIPDKGTYYRLRAGPLADKAAAETLCSALIARNVSCLVVRP